MSKPKFKVTKGLAFVITTGEPVYVTGLEGDLATVTRGVGGENQGPTYIEETFPVEQLETRHEQIKRNMEYAEYAEELKIGMDRRLYQFAAEEDKKPQAKVPSLAQLIPMKTDA